MPSFVTPFHYYFFLFPLHNTYSFQIGSVSLLILLIFLSIVCLCLLEYSCIMMTELFGNVSIPVSLLVRTVSGKL